jgi:membrane peptidoglycan carboxypeptidase
MRSKKETDDSFRRATFIGVMACATIALTAWAAGAQESPEKGVQEAVETAERAAATETTLERMESDDGSDSNSAPSLSTLGRGFAPEDVSVVPDNWKEAGLDVDEAERVGDRLVQTLSNGLQVELTIDPELQRHLEQKLADYSVPHGGVVLVEPETGRVLAMVSQTNHQPEMPALARHAAAPAASTFKIVSAAALIEGAGVNPDREVCYHGGTSHLTRENITGSPHDDNCRHDLGGALTWSINSIIAKLAHKHLDRQDLKVWAKRFGFNTEIPFELPVEASTAEIVEDPMERARTAAGFWHTYLSPLHGALIGASLSNGGLMMRPSIIEEVRTQSGEVLESFEPKVLRRVMSTETANLIGKMLKGTTSKGTADRYFAHRGAFPNDVRAAGKTGTLSKDDPYLSFTWFVGFGEHRHVDGRKAAVGGLICNTPKWRIKGPYAASEGLRKYFQLQRQRAQADSGDRLAAQD